MTETNAIGRDFWNSSAGRSWVEQEVLLDSMNMPAARVLFSSAGLLPGQRVVDIGCGGGATTLAAATAVIPGGVAYGYDIAEPLVKRARQRAAEAELDNMIVELADVQGLTVPDHLRFDIAISRFGVMFFDDPVRAFTSIRNLLRPGGRLSFVSWAGLEHNPWFRLPMEAAVARLGPAPPVDPNAPGPLAFRDRGRVEDILENAGFRRIASRATDIELPMPGGAEAGAALARHVGPVARLLKARGGTEEDREAIFASLGKRLKAFEVDGELRIPARINLFEATAP